MREVNLTELMDNCYVSKWNLEQAAARQGRDVQIFLHWTACPYGRYYSSYHVNIDYDGTIVLMADLDEVLSHTIDKQHVLTHGEIADCEDGSPVYWDGKYGPKTTVDRWDLEVLWDENGESPRYNPWDEEHRGGTILRGKANWYKYQFYGHY